MRARLVLPVPRRSTLSTALLVVLWSTGMYTLGRFAGARQPAAAAAGGTSGTLGSARRVAASQTLAPGGGQVDFEYDPMQHPTGPEAAVDTPPPLRRPGFKPVTNDNQGKYDQMWTGKQTYQKNSCWGCRFAGDVVARIDFHTVLDAGTGNGGSVRAMRLRGKAAFGIELSQAVLERDAPDLLAAGYVEQGSLTNLPYQDKQFDLVFSSDVLEHIRPEEADQVVSELVRVAKRHIVMSISLKSYQNVDLHSLLRPRAWWEAKFEAAGARTNRPLVWALQQKETRFQRDKDFTACKWEGNATDGGLFEVCTAGMPWLVGRPGQELRSYRCVTTANAEVEPWMFAFTVD
ncbi:methyltransferase type 11 [Micractinium conductrix]|uniref:Methyltransferase type 11 n=1 Tax=Micractinium conductrix TaxID=554055 RepID=A0A2P6VMU5_9CHLO|nr:methyltransferase type 11 [Micractinium conductrix]|eukprot:PSC75409.1 methyltransferase type 11 [Micractinium conductrix]